VYDSSIFSPSRLGSEEEEISLQYNGWAILSRIKADNSTQAIRRIKYTFSGDGYEFNEKDNRYFIQSDLCDSPIEVIPEKIKYKDTYTLKTETFNVWFQSETFGFKWSEESVHRKLCYDVLSRLPKKRGFWIKEGKLFPIPKKRQRVIPKRKYHFSFR
jgi:hypothetical protein